MSNNVKRLATLVAATALSVGARAAHDHNAHLFSVFLSAEGRVASGDPGKDGSEFDAVADVIMSHQAGPWRLLGELVLSPDEHEMERAQVGYEVADNTILWVGRFHQPSSVWNVLFHHGQFLQTSITRPAIEEWEDEHGILPQHIIGAMAESLITTSGAAGWRISASGGLSPRVDKNLLRPYVPFRGTDANLTHASLRLEWLPDALGEDVAGVVLSRTRMRRDDSLVAPGPPVTVRIAGVFANMGKGNLRALGNLMLLDTAGSAVTPLGFRQHLAGYLQLEVAVHPGATLFARHELLTHSQSSAYLALLNAPPARRTIAGGRVQLGLRNAITLELAHSKTQSAGALRELRLQWSAAIP
jgi:hypothetical protein